jgi:tetratricopeptide (TPR) repeat protein
MDSLITAAARALAAGDPLGALNRVALRDDAPALALRGIAMAQLGDLVRAKALLRGAARAFGPKEAVARARCVVAEAEIALVSRDLGWPAKALDAARATLEAHGDRVNAAHARNLEIRRLLLIGRLDEAEHALAELDPAPFPPASRAAHELVVAGIAIRRLRTKPARAALARAERAARHADIPALTAEVESASLVLNTPVARLIARGGERLLLLEDVEALLARRRSSWMRAVTWCVTHARWSRSQGVRYCSRSRARWARRGPQTRRGVRSSRGHSEQSTPMNRIARGCE